MKGIRGPRVILTAMCLALLILSCGRYVASSEERYSSGANLQNQGHLEEAISEYDEAIRLDPQFAVAYNNRGNAYAGLGQYEKAIADLDEAIRLRPKVALAYNNRGNAYNNLRKFKRAIQDLDEAIRLDPQLTEAYAGRALAYIFLSKHVDAQQDIERAVELGVSREDLEALVEEAKRRR